MVLKKLYMKIENGISEVIDGTFSAFMCLLVEINKYKYLMT